MKNVKILSVFAGLSLLAASLLPVSVSALSVGSMTMDGGYSTDGRFSVIVYENTGADTVTGAGVTLTFSQPVTNVSYDYSVGPFTAVDYSGAHNAFGTVTGRNPLARVSFTLPNPGTVVADVSASGSYLWHVDGASVLDFAFEKGQAYFTYTAPEPKAAAPVNNTPAAATQTEQQPVVDTPAPLTNDVKAAETTKAATTTETAQTSRVGVIASATTTLLVLAAAAAYWLLIHRRAEVAPVKAYKLDAPTAASKTKPAKKKLSTKSAARKR